MVNQQETIKKKMLKKFSQKLNVGSSETTREILLANFCFERYIQFGTPQHKPNPNIRFLEWFVGFFEAEGSFLKWTDKNNKNRFGIEIIQKDVQLIYKIRTQLGFGKVTQCTKNNKIYWRYYVHDLKNLIRFIWLVNGNLVTENKQNQFQLWLNDFNIRNNSNFLFLKNSMNLSLKTAWLSGFFEGNAGFWVNSKNVIQVNKDNSQSYSIQMKFFITQKNEIELLTQIKKLFKISSEISQIINRDSSEKYNRLETNELMSHLRILKYLTNYPFLGKRYILFNRWKRILGYRINKYPITKKSILKLKRLILSTKINY